MNIVVRHKIMRIEDFLAWEVRQTAKYEFDGFEPVAMAGGSRNHARIQRNLAIAIGTRLRGTKCEFLGSDMKLVTATRCRYPDGQVACSSQDSGEATFTTSPSILFEVISASTETKDRVEKATEYHALPSLQQYVLLEQDRISVTVNSRTGEGWESREISSGTLELPTLGLEIPLAELYEGVMFAVA